MQIGGLQKLTLIDYPNKLACTIFLAGCSFRCPWCYNPNLVLPEKIQEQPLLKEKEVFTFLKERQGLLEAVVLGGGEPSIHPELTGFCQKIKNLGYAIKLDTNGSNPRLIDKLIKGGWIDYIALDIKAPPEKYAELIGLKNQMDVPDHQLDFWQKKVIDNINQSINLLKEGGVDYEFRTTVIPGLINKSDILKIVEWIKPAKRYYLQEFRPERTINPVFEKKKPYPRHRLTEIQKAVAPFFEICQIRN